MSSIPVQGIRQLEIACSENIRSYVPAGGSVRYVEASKPAAGTTAGPVLHSHSKVNSLSS